MNNESQSRPRPLAEILEASSSDFLKQSLERTPHLGTWTKLYAASKILLAAMRDGRVIAVLLEISSNLLGCEHLAIVEIEVESGRIQLLGEEGLSPKDREALLKNGGLLEPLIAPGGPWIPSDRAERYSPLVPHGISALVPLWKDERSSAVIVLFGLLPQSNGFDAEDREVLQLLSLYAGPCLRNQKRG